MACAHLRNCLWARRAALTARPYGVTKHSTLLITCASHSGGASAPRGIGLISALSSARHGLGRFEQRDEPLLQRAALPMQPPRLWPRGAGGVGEGTGRAVRSRKWSSSASARGEGVRPAAGPMAAPRRTSSRRARPRPAETSARASAAGTTASHEPCTTSTCCAPRALQRATRPAQRRDGRRGGERGGGRADPRGTAASEGAARPAWAQSRRAAGARRSVGPAHAPRASSTAAVAPPQE